MKHPKLVIAALSVVVVILGIVLFNDIRARSDSDERLRFVQQMADNSFRYQLGEAASSFGKDMDEDEASFHQCVAAVSAAAALAKLTSFEKQNDGIDVVLDGFGKNLLNPSNRAAVLGKAPELRELFAKLNQNPADKETTNKLAEFGDTLR
ncbi:hypothetical protein [Paenibacillus sacheonensis]|uniref:Uncharacterized protein n=1 Tax=Paenibacillus sacheonensis TaxID=742054 RepID=A0A7X4YV17_9BACL|nr:hypothetical protein [Paenibacillus sacheonensis]MBM7568443.1 hypothetical protein [Paenibacillus sacheonensis]NBC72141.1 hypothetical protein [Paenibacillus sacheonensis]